MAACCAIRDALRITTSHAQQRQYDDTERMGGMQTKPVDYLDAALAALRSSDNAYDRSKTTDSALRPEAGVFESDYRAAAAGD
jgi:hypothetical protein